MLPVFQNTSLRGFSLNTFSSIGEGVGFYRKASEILRAKHGLSLHTHVGPMATDCKNNNSPIYRIKRGSSRNGKGLFARALYDSSKDKFQFIYCGSYLRPHEKGHRKCIDWFKKPRTELHLPTFQPHEQMKKQHQISPQRPGRRALEGVSGLIIRNQVKEE